MHRSFNVWQKKTALIYFVLYQWFMTMLNVVLPLFVYPPYSVNLCPQNLCLFKSRPSWYWTQEISKVNAQLFFWLISHANGQKTNELSWHQIRIPWWHLISLQERNDKLFVKEKEWSDVIVLAISFYLVHFCITIGKHCHF